MNIHNGLLYWPTTTTSFHLKKQPNALDIYDAVIVGGGMSGALTALTLSEAGLQVAVLDKRIPGSGSTSANTGLLQYSNDIMLHDLIGQISEKDAVRFYQLCYDALEKLENVSKNLDIEPQFIRRPSLYFASDENDTEKIRAEYDTLHKYGFPCDFIGKNEIASKFSFVKDSALLTYGDAEINPLRFVQGVLKKAEGLGVHLFPKTEVKDVYNPEDYVEIKTSNQTFFAKEIVYTTGYETVPVGERIGADIKRSYVAVTKPVSEITEWYKRALIWETQRPYLYLRTTIDNRIIIGGLDEDNPNAPYSQQLIDERAKTLLQEAKNLFPHIPLEIDYAYAASFGESLQNLPFIGQHPTKEKHYYLLGYGGNGTVYSMLGSVIIRDLLMSIPNDDASIVCLERTMGIV